MGKRGHACVTGIDGLSGGRRLIGGLALGIVLTLAWLSPAAAQDEAAQDEVLRADASARVTIGGGVPFGLYFPLAGAICRLVETADGGGRGCDVASLPDSAAAIEALDSGRVDFALVQSDWLAHAVEGTSRFNGSGAVPGLRGVAALHGEGLVLFVRAADGLAGPEALDGMRIVRGPEQSYRTLLTYALLRAVDLTPEDLAKGSDEDVGAGLAMLCAGKTDAVAAVTAAPGALVSAAPADCAVEALPLDAETAADAVADMPGVNAFALPAPETGGARIESIGLRAVLTAHERTDPAVVRQLVQALGDGIETLNGQHPALADLDRAGLSGAARFAPLHEGVRSVYAAE